MDIVSKLQPSSSNGFGVMIFWRFGGKASVTDLFNDQVVCRTAPATLGLLIIYMLSVILKAHIWPWRAWLKYFLSVTMVIAKQNEQTNTILYLF